MSAVRRPLVLVLLLLALCACTAPDAGLELTVHFDPALALDQLAVRLQAGEAVEEVRAPEPPALLDSGEETLGFLLPESLIDVEVTVAVLGFGDGAVVPGAALVAEGQGLVTPTRGQISALVVELSPLAVCGNGILEVREACDDGNAAAGDGCDESCAIESGYVCAGAPSVCARCGDGSIDAPESCDDGGQGAGDGCDESCAVESGWVCDGAEPTGCATVCGDGVLRGTEACDDGNGSDDDGCSAACALETGWSCGAAEPTTCAAVCGDGLVRGAEACDDQDLDGGDGCSASCAVEGGFGCNGAEPSACAATCGDGLVRGGEACDDGNSGDNDGCSAACAEESGFQCTGEPSACATVCGDGVPAGTEACDDGAANSDTTPDACRTDCTLPFCGDLVVDSGEGCDDGDLDDRDGCRTGCRLPSCGDGLVLGAESCDDGDAAGGDGCNASCGVEGGFSCFGEPSVCAATALTHVVAPSGGQFTSIDAADNSGTVADGHFLFIRAGTYAEEVDLAKDLTLVGESGARVLANANNASAIRIRGSANVTLQGLTVEHDGNNQPAIELRDGGGAVTVTDCVLGPTNNLGLESVAGTTVTVRRTLITGNPDGGADLNGTVLVENSVMIGNGSAGSSFGGAYLRSAASFRFNTVVDNLGATGVLCNAAAAATLTSSILWGNAGPETSGGCATGTSWVQGVGGATDPLFLGDGYHLGTGSPVLDQTSAAACPALDFDGQERPMGADCEPGADERP